MLLVTFRESFPYFFVAFFIVLLLRVYIQEMIFHIPKKTWTPPIHQENRRTLFIHFLLNKVSVKSVLILGFILFLNQYVFSYMGSYQDSRDQESYKTISYGELNWLHENLRYQEESSYAVNSKRIFYSQESVSLLCPAPYTLPSVEDWRSLELMFLKQRTRKAYRSFIGKPFGYYIQKGNKKRSQNKNGPYFWAKSDNGYQVVRFNHKTGKMSVESPVPNSFVTARCVRPREYLVEKGVQDNILTDTRNGKQYPVYILEDKIWMKANLAYDPSSPASKKDTLDPKNCYMEDSNFCTKFGRYYTWSEAKNACPAGWRLPSDSDWRQFIKQKSIPWQSMGQGGCKDWDSYGDGSNAGHYWSSSKTQKSTARAFEFRKATKAIDRTDEDLKKGLYVRCVADIKE